MSGARTTGRRGRGTLTRVAAACVLALTLGAVSGCSSSGPHEVTEAEAERLAEALYANWEAEGLTFELNSTPRPGATVRVQGQVNFVNEVGYGLVTAVGEDAPVAGVIFTPTSVLENIPTLVDASAGFGGPEFTWVARPLDSSAYDLDGLLAVVFGLATEQRDNPALIMQSEARWLREDTLRGTPVDVFEYSPQARFWIEKDGTRLLRFEGNNDTLTRPIVVDVTELGPGTAPQFAESDVVTVDALDGLYDAYRRGPTS